jgi:hypothetical protein
MNFKVVDAKFTDVECAECGRVSHVDDFTPTHNGGAYLCSTCTPKWTCKCGRVEHSAKVFHGDGCEVCAPFTECLRSIYEQLEQAEYERDQWRAAYMRGVSVGVGPGEVG